MIEPWTCKKPFDLRDDNFSIIFRFFVIETPIGEDSVRSISFKERGISQKAVLPKLKSISKELSSNWMPIFEEKNDSHLTSIKEFCSSNGVSKHDKKGIELAIFKVPKKININTAFIHFIRCSLAHGGFCIHQFNNEKYYYFENINNTENTLEINSRFIIKEETLVKFVNYCNSNLEESIE